MSDIVLVHGACHGAWAWDLVIPELAARGHHALALDLPGRGGPASLQQQAQAVLAKLPGPGVLVGHSAGGFAITAAAELNPARVAGLIYVCAYVPRPGQSLAQMRRAGPSQPLRGAFRLAADRQTYGFDPARAADLFFHDCPDPAGAAALLCHEALAPMETALPFTHSAEALPRGYIRCDHDRTIPPAYQDEMATGIAHRANLPCGHAPFLAQPAALADRIAAMVAAMTPGQTPA